ncbi:hypothetical protein BGZ65_000207 [Modicella reniformis]|uniref:Uncharacterized protein n=1 Tax=Modicella reniformis TaxID=1440133 RepID=A0A9P6MBS6_9FUNG|nr:hypothetical protein BGZ65_000207 [Modicella reniformis]
MSEPFPVGGYLQEFRLSQPAGSEPSQATSIRTRYDNNASNEHFVLFEEIQTSFKHAVRVMKGMELVPFEVDHRFIRIEPLRIKYHSEVILDVVVDNPGKGIAEDTGRTNITLEEIAVCLATMVQNEVNKKHLHTEIKDHLRPQLQEINQNLEKNLMNTEKILMNTEKIENMGHTTLDRLSIIQDRVQALIIQTYELHEYPIPRLFIVLPKQQTNMDKVTKSFSNQYHLYFLCECGQHTISNNPEIPHEIHLAHHEGYDIQQPTEFLKKYGDHVLRVLQLIKYGFAVAGVVMPPLAHLKVVEGLETFQKAFQPIINDLKSKVESFINELEEQEDLGKKSSLDESAAHERTKFENVHVLKGAELRQIESYLIRHDKGRVLGNLNRIVTLDGHVKWVCNYHRGSHRDKSMQQLREVVRLNNGSLNMKTGKITVKLSSKKTAEQLYDAIKKAVTIQSLDIQLEWNASQKDLQLFADTVCDVKITQLDMDGSCFKTPILEGLRHSERYSPILKIMSEGSIQTLNLMQFTNFFNRVNKSSIVKADRLKVLTIDSNLALSDKGFKAVFIPIFKQCTNLKELRLTSEKRFELYQHFEEVDDLGNLSELTLTHMEHTVTLDIKTKTMTMTVTRLKNLTPDDEKFLRLSNLTVLKLKHAPEEPEEKEEKVRLAEILCMRAGLNEIQIGCRIEQVLATVDLIKSTRVQLIKQGSCRLSKLVLTDNSDSTHQDGIRMTLNFTDPSSDSSSASIEIMRAVVPLGSSNCIEEIVRQYGRSIHRLETTSSFNCRFATLLHTTFLNEGSSFRRLHLNTKSLEVEGRNNIDQVIACSPHLERLEWCLDELHQESQFQKLDWVLNQHAARLSAMILKGNESSMWIPKLAQKYPTRHKFPLLESFRIICSDKPNLSEACAGWIAAMVSAPRQGIAPSSLSSLSSQSSSSSTQPSSSQQAAARSPLTDTQEQWKPLKEIAVENVRLEPKGWESVIKSIDFSALETLSFNDTDFSLAQFKTLVNNIPKIYNGAEVPLTTLDVERTALATAEKVHEIWDQVRLFEKNAPLVDIKGLRSTTTRGTTRYYTIKALISDLQDERLLVRILSRRVENSEAVVVTPVGAVLDMSASIRKEVVSVLTKQIKLPEVSIQTLIEALQLEDHEMRRATVEVLGQVNSSGTVIEALISSLRDELERQE